MVSKYKPPQLDPSKWFMWIESPGYTYEDITAWKLEIDSEGQIVQILYDKFICWGEPRESHIVQLSAEELQEVHRRIDEINFPRLKELSYLGLAKDCASCRLQLRGKDSLIEISTCLPMVFDGIHGLRWRKKMSRPGFGIEELDFDSDCAEIRRLVSLLELILSRCPIQRWHWMTEC